MAIKFNDYFEFPREFDMAPYTAAVLSEVDGKPSFVSLLCNIATPSFQLRISVGAVSCYGLDDTLPVFYAVS